MVEIKGYYKESEILTEGKESYIVAIHNSKIDGKRKWLEAFHIHDGHCEIENVYLATCKEVTKDEYKDKTKGFYTPIEYL